MVLGCRPEGHRRWWAGRMVRFASGQSEWWWAVSDVERKRKLLPGPVRRKHPKVVRFFYFYIFLFPFFTKIYFRFGNLQKYTPAAPLPGGRDLTARQPGGRGLSAKKIDKKLCRGPWRTGRPAAGRPALQAARRRALAARLRGDRPPNPI